MSTKRTLADDERDRQAVLNYLRPRRGQDCKPAEIKIATGVAKNRVRSLMQGVPGIDAEKLEKGLLCWNPPSGTPSLT